MEKSLIATLKDKKAQLETELAKSTDAKSYDLLDEELRHVTKTLILSENQERARIEKEKEDNRKAAMAARMAIVEGVAKSKSEQRKLDAALFDKLNETREAFDKAYANAQQISENTIALQRSAEELGLEPPASVPIQVANWISSASPDDFYVEIISQYNLAAREVKGAKKNKVAGAPTKPELSWYHKGHGEYFPRDPEPDPKVVFAAFMKEQYAENAKAKQAKQGLP